MTADVMGLITLSLTLSVHLIATAWWAASITRRVDHIEKWIASHEHTAARLAALEQQMQNVGNGIERIEHLVRHRY